MNEFIELGHEMALHVEYAMKYECCWEVLHEFVKHERVRIGCEKV